MNLAAVMSLDAAAFTGPLGGANKAMQGSIGSIGGMMGKLAGLAAGFLSIRAIMNGVSGATKLGAELDHQSKQTGIAVDQLLILRQAFDDTGVGASSMADTMAYMQRNMEAVDKAGNSTNKGFAKLKINLGSFKQLGAADQLELIQTKINGLSTQSEKTAAAMDIFGRSGSKLLQLFAAGDAFGDARKSLGSMPALMARNAAAFESFDTMVGRAKGKFTGLWAGMLQSAMPGLNAIMAQVDAIDFAAWGQKITESFQVGLAVFKSGQMGKVVELSIGIAFQSALNFLIGPLMSLNTWKGIGQIILAGFMGIGAGLIKIFTEPILLLQAGMDKVVDELFAAIGKIPGIGKALGLDTYGETKTFSEHLAERRASGTFISRSGDDAAALAKEMYGAGKANLSAGVAASKDVFDPSGMQSELSAILSEARDSIAQIAPAVSGAVANVGGGQTNAAATGGSIKTSAADRLAQIGLFVGAGGQSGTQVRLAERTAKATEKMGELLKQLLAKDTDVPLAVWG